MRLTLCDLQQVVVTNLPQETLKRQSQLQDKRDKLAAKVGCRDMFARCSRF